jgi:Spinocerebellar ataxia type 10 protein domain
LSFSAFDKANPLTREATILLIRYLTDSNQRAKDEIAKLDVKKLDEDGVKEWNDFCKDMQAKEHGGSFL